MFSHFSLKEVGEMFVRQYREGNYQARLRKIEIPDKYEFKTEYSKEGIVWLIQQWVSHSEGVYEEKFLLKWLLLAFS